MVDDAENIDSRERLVAFVLALRSDLLVNADDWENPTLESFLEALAAWINDERAWSGDLGGERVWRYIGRALDAARIYE